MVGALSRSYNHIFLPQTKRLCGKWEMMEMQEWSCTIPLRKACGRGEGVSFLAISHFCQGVCDEVSVGGSRVGHKPALS